MGAKKAARGSTPSPGGKKRIKRRWRVQCLSRRADRLNARLARSVITRALTQLELWGDYPPPPPSVIRVSVLFTDDKEIHDLNKTFRGKDKPTDVLSFSQLEGDGEAAEDLGDIVISLDTAGRQAQRYKTSREQELRRLLIHGCCHLYGYDHEKVRPGVAALMRKRERALLRAEVAPA